MKIHEYLVYVLLEYLCITKIFNPCSISVCEICVYFITVVVKCCHRLINLTESSDKWLTIYTGESFYQIINLIV